MKIPSAQEIKNLRKADKIPPGWFSRDQCEKEWKVTQAAAAALIRTAITAGKCDMKKFLIHTDRRGLYPTQYYRFK